MIEHRVPAPPQLAARLLAARLSSEWLEFVLGDLDEGFQKRAARSLPGARRWYWWQTIRCLIAPPPSPRPAAARARRSTPMIQSLWADVRLALRVFRRAPGFALSVVAVLTLGIGANTAIFSIVNAVLLRPLPFTDADGLVRVFHTPPQDTFPGIKLFSVSPANFLDWQRQNTVFDAMAAYTVGDSTLTGHGAADSVRTGFVGPDFFRVVHDRPILGRALDAEDAAGAGRVAVISEGFWRNRLGATLNPVGQSIVLDGVATAIVGVMPARFSVPSWGATTAQVWKPLLWTDAQRAVRDNHNYAVVARLKPGVGVAQANADLDAISRRLAQEYPKEDAGWGATSMTLQELIVGDRRPALIALAAAVGLVLLVACANVTNLLLARSLSRSKEMAVRTALGAGRGRVLQQLLVEALTLACAGGALGFLVARVGMAAIASMIADQVPRADEIGVDGRVLLFTIGASLVAGVLAGVVPAWRAGRTDLLSSLKDGGRSEPGVAAFGTRRLLIVGEVALSLVLLAGAAAMVRSLLALRHVDLGFNRDGVLTMNLTLPQTPYDTDARKNAFFDDAIAQVRALPGVTSAGYTDTLPISGGGSIQPVALDGQTGRRTDELPTVDVRIVAPGFMQTLQIPIVKGRDVEPLDTDAVLVSATMARLIWPGRDPIGQRAGFPIMSRTCTVVGVVGDARQDDIKDQPPATAYWYSKTMPVSRLTLVARSSRAPDALIKPVTAAIASIDPNIPPRDVRTLRQVVDRTLSPAQFDAWIFGGFAMLALVLTSLGIFSVLSYLVRGRQREIGIRTALGAGVGDVVGLVVGEGLKPTIAGIAIGVAIALGAGRVLERVVFGVSATDPWTLAGVAALLAAVAIAASLLPAWRASRVKPLRVLR